jgi:hypothetical protein
VTYPDHFLRMQQAEFGAASGLDLVDHEAGKDLYTATRQP